MIFSRSRGKARRGSAESSGQAGNGGDETEALAAATPGFGPYDADEVPDDGRERLDLGALRIPAIPGVEVRIQAGPEGQIQQIALVEGEGSVQLGAFAAPRTEGIWDEVRAQIRASLAADRAEPTELTGDYGVELRARVRTQDGPTELRFVGVDGPRWFLQAVFQGKAAVPGYDGALREALRAVVVDRGNQAMPVHEALPLRLPPEAGAQVAAQSAARNGGQR